MNPIKIFCLSFVCLISFCMDARSVELVHDGQPCSVIVVPDDCFPVVRYAADELQYFIAKATGATLPIYTESNKPSGPAVWLGNCRASRQLDVDTATLAPNGFVMVAEGSDLFLFGDDSDGAVIGTPGHEQSITFNMTRVGTLFAVYEFLERFMGVRWLWPGELGEVVPSQAAVSIADLREIVLPQRQYTRWRDYSFVNGTAGWSDPAVRTRFLREQSIWLRRHRFAMGSETGAGHAFQQYWDRFSDSHREYFNLLPDGRRDIDPTSAEVPHHNHISMCVSQPQLWRQIVSDWQERRSPGSHIINCCENDTLGRCTCPNCLAWDAAPAGDAELLRRFSISTTCPLDCTPAPAELVSYQQAETLFEAVDPRWVLYLGSLSDRYARFYLSVQQEAAQIDPDAIIVAYAYANYCQPPVQTTLNRRIWIGVVPALMYPWTPEPRTMFRQQWAGWSDAGASLFLRPNYTMTGHNLPIALAHKLGEDLSFALQRNLIGADFDTLTGQWATQGPHLYTLARVLNHPDWSVDRILDEYYAAFGPAQQAVRSYFEYWEAVDETVTDEQFAQFAQLRRVPPGTANQRMFYCVADLIFTESVMAQGRELLDEAIAAAGDDELACARVTFLEKGFIHAELTLAAQFAWQKSVSLADLRYFAQAVEQLDDYRMAIEADLTANMGFLRWAEDFTWNRTAVDYLAP